jgi:hypothetical protein
MASRRPYIVQTLFAGAVLGLFGCSQPVVSPHGIVLQQSANAEIDWENSVRRVVASMEQQGMIQTPSHPLASGRFPYPGPYFLFVQQPGSAFLEDVRHIMEYELLKRGAVVVRSPGGATVINLDLDTIRWGGLEPVSDTELVWRAGIVSNNRVIMKSSDLLYISASDIPLYQGTTTLAPLASPGVSMLGAATQLRYAR